LGEDGSQRNFCFAGDGLGLSEKWRKVNVVLPMPKDLQGSRTRPQSEMDGPFLRIKHTLKIRLLCRAVGAAEDDVNVSGSCQRSIWRRRGHLLTHQAVLLSAPIHFGTTPATLYADKPPSLPPYVQLFHENGDQRECDPLPLYTEPEPCLSILTPTTIQPPHSLLASSNLVCPAPSVSYPRAISPTGTTQSARSTERSSFSNRSPESESDGESPDRSDVSEPMDVDSDAYEGERGWLERAGEAGSGQVRTMAKLRVPGMSVRAI
jgi:hypothetical protein